MSLGLRPRLLLCSVAPFAVVAGAAAGAAPGWAVAALAVAAGGAAAAGVWHQTRGLLALHRAAAGLADDELPVADPTEVGGVARAVKLVREQAAEHDRQFLFALTHTAAVLAGTADNWKRPPEIAVPDSPWPDKSEALADAAGRVAQALGSANRRLLALQGVLNDLPDPVLVFDPAQKLQFMNAAGEELFRHLPDRGVRQPLAKFLAVPPPLDVSNPDAPRGLAPKEVQQWLGQAGGGTCFAVAAAADKQAVPVEVAVRPQGKRRLQNGTVLTLRDVSASRDTEEAARHRQRGVLGKRLCRVLAREAAPALEVIRSQAALLGQAAKQVGQRERFLPKVQRIQDEIGRQELVLAVLGWLGRSNTSTAGHVEPREVRVADVAREVAGKMAPAFAERGNSILVTGDAGWLLADEELVTVLLTGVLMHANLAADRAGVTVQLRRRSVVQAADELSEIVVDVPGPPLPEHMLEDVRDPFRRAYSAAFDTSGQTGFLLGLSVAHAVTGLLYGQFSVEPTADGTTVRALIPTRADKSRTVGRASTVRAAEVEAEVSDALGGWLVGGRADGAAADDTPTDDHSPVRAPAHAAPVAVAAAHDPVPDETVGGWFGGGD